MTGRRTALIIANDVYEHDGLRALRSPAADAAALAEVLSDRRISDFDVHVVRNETAHVVLGRIEDLFADSKPDDVLLLHFSCHGLKGESGELHFAMRDTRPDRLRSTGVSADYVQRCMAASRSRSIVLLLDCCYGGAYRQGVAVRAAGDAHVFDSFTGGKGRAVITASSAMEYAFEGDRLADDEPPLPSVFTAAVVEGLATGAADRDQDGLIGLGELYDYVYEKVRDRNPNQTPGRDVEMHGELYLARSDRKRLLPLPMPPDLVAATTDPNMFSRLGAVGELRGRLASENLQVAMGAHSVLTRMASTDIQNVVAVVRTALHDVDIRPATDSVRIGPSGVGSILLLGPPLARKCAFTSEQGWIRITPVNEGADIEVTPADEARHGIVVVTGPTGRVEIPVVAEPAPSTPPRPRITDPMTKPVSARLTTVTAAGLLAILAGLVMIYGLHLQRAPFQGFDVASFRIWYVESMIGPALVGGVAAVSTRSRPLRAAGFLIAIAIASVWGAGSAVSSVTTASNTQPDVGMFVELSGYGMVLAAGGLAAAAVIRAGTATFVRHRYDGWLVSRMAVSLIGAIALYGWSARADGGTEIAATALLAAALVVQFGSPFLAPHQFSLAVHVGFLFSGVFACVLLWYSNFLHGLETGALAVFTAALPINLAIAARDRPKALTAGRPTS